MSEHRRYALLARRLLGLYPSTWRQRYEPEMQALLEACPITLKTLLDLLFGALDAHLSPPGKKERFFFMFRTIRMTSVTFACAFLLYALATHILQFETLNNYSGLGPRGALGIVSSVGTVALQLALLTSNLIIAIMLFREHFSHKRKGTILFAIVCLAAMLLWPWIQALTFVVLSGIQDPPKFLYAFAQGHFTLSLHSALLWSGVFALACNAKEVLARRRQTLLAFGLVSYLIIPQILASLLLELVNMYNTGYWDPSLWHWLLWLQQSTQSLLPYSLAIGALAVMMGRKEASQHTKVLMTIAACTVALFMIAMMGAMVLALFFWIVGGMPVQVAGSALSARVLPLFNGIYMCIGVVVACVALVRWLRLRMTRPFQEEKLVLPTQQP